MADALWRWAPGMLPPDGGIALRPPVQLRVGGRGPYVGHAWALLILVSLAFAGLESGKGGCPSRCICTDSHSSLMVSCVNKKYTELPEVPLYTTDLEMSLNNLTALRDDAFQGLDMLHTLRLDFNQIHTVEPRAFNNLRHLTVLTLHNNKISHVDVHVFKNLKTLRRLYLNHNSLTYLLPHLFLFNTELHILDIRNNRIVLIQGETFQKLTALTELHISGNPLRQLPHDAFQNLTSLTELNMASAKLKSIHPDLLSNQTKLASLDLSDNKLHNLNPALFRHLSNLEYLNLSGNPFHCDCKVAPLKAWVEESLIKMWTQSNTPRCATPEALSGTYLHLVPAGNLTCANKEKKTKDTVAKETKKINKYRSNLGKIPYDPMMGWYIAATLAGMLVLFLICVLLDYLKRRYYKWRREKRKMKEKYQYCRQNGGENGQSQRKCSLEGIDFGGMFGGHVNVLASNPLTVDDFRHFSMDDIKTRSSHPVVKLKPLDGILKSPDRRGSKVRSKSVENTVSTYGGIQITTDDGLHDLFINMCDSESKPRRNGPKNTIRLKVNETTL